MAASTLTFTLPEPLKQYVDNRVEYGEFGTPGEYVRTLIRQDREQRLSSLEEELLVAMDSEEIEITPEELAAGNIVDTLRARLLKKV